jgi:hypothetical protein
LCRYYELEPKKIKCQRRARFQGSQTCVSLNSRLVRNKEEAYNVPPYCADITSSSRTRSDSPTLMRYYWGIRKHVPPPPIFERWCALMACPALCRYYEFEPNKIKCQRRARFQGSQTCLSINSRLVRNKEEAYNVPPHSADITSSSRTRSDSPTLRATARDATRAHPSIL